MGYCVWCGLEDDGQNDDGLCVECARDVMVSALMDAGVYPSGKVTAGSEGDGLFAFAVGLMRAQAEATR